MHCMDQSIFPFWNVPHDSRGDGGSPRVREQRDRKEFYRRLDKQEDDLIVVRDFRRDAAVRVADESGLYGANNYCQKKDAVLGIGREVGSTQWSSSSQDADGLDEEPERVGVL